MLDYRTSGLNATLFLCFFILVGCQQKSTMISQKSRSEISPAPIEISKVNVLNWRVGPKQDQTVSRGISISINLPLLETDDLQKVVADRNADAWIVQLHRRGVSNIEVLARTAVPLTGISSQMETIVFPIHYAASALSMRRAQMRCPSFDHRYVIDDVEITQAPNQGMKKIILSPSKGKPQRGKFELYQLRPSSINGGHRLEGDYSVELALFNLEQKKLKSNFVTFPEIVKVRSEDKIILKGCENYRESGPGGNGDLNDFRFGR